MSYLFYGINSAIKYARDGYSKELSDFLSKKPHLVNQRNKNGNSILHIACWKGDNDMVLMLLMRGADVNCVDSKGYSPLLVAIEFGHDALALSLLERGADITIGNQACCLPLHVAALTGCKNIVIPLLDRGADINAIETNGCTPLLCALRGKHSDVAMILIDKGADLTARDRDEWLPAGLAKLNGLTAVVSAIALRLDYQSMVANRSGGGNTVENRNDYTSENDDATPPSRNPSKQPQLNSTRPRTGLGGDEIDVSRSQSQPALLHTMTASSGASVTSAGATSKASKCSRSSKSRKLERRSSTSAMSTVATTAAIEAVTKAMQDCGGDVSKAALLLIQQQQQQQMTRSRDGVKRRSSRKEDRSDEFSVSVISEGTTGSSRARASSKKNRTSSRDLDIYDNINDEERSVNSGSTRNSRNASKKNERRPSDSSFRSGSIDNKGPLLDVGMKSKSDRGGALMPIEEEVLVRRGNRTGSKSSKGRVRIEEGRGNNESSRLDDVDSDGEPFGPPAIFCFWNKPAIRVPPSTSTSDTILSAKIHNDRSLCLIM